MDWFTPLSKAISGIANARSSVFNPLLTLNFAIDSFSVIVYFRSGDILTFIPALILLVYSIYRHERWANDVPHMLSSETVQVHGMDLTMGSSDQPAIAESAVDAMKPIKNPELDEGEIIGVSTQKEEVQ